jgi:hypothetical protein
MCVDDESIDDDPKLWWGMGAPRLSDQSDRVFILGVETSTT